MNLTEEEMISFYNLVPHPTCGLIKQSYISDTILPGNILPTKFGNNNRPAGSFLYFLVSSRAKTKLHKISSDQMYHFYVGFPLEVMLLYPDGNAEIKIMGSDIKAGMLSQLFIPGDTFHMSKLHGDGPYSFLGTSEWIGVLPNDIILGDPDKLICQYPSFKDEIKRFI